ncbi:MAG: hypothetical protein JXB60_06580 [Candidatus Cloacimonetes bacterium]|nr:hypothetical protein [Candidatus Cloacimonadota bacterium]
MKIRKLALLCVIFMAMNFINRITGTFLIQPYHNKTIFNISMMIPLITSFLYLLFFLALYREFSAQQDLKMKRITLLPLAGSILSFLHQLRMILDLHDIELVKIHTGYIWILILPLLVTLTFICFLLVLHSVTRNRIQALARATMMGVVGFGFTAIIHLYLLLNFILLSYKPMFLLIDRYLTILVLPLLFFSNVAVMYFFYFIYRHTESITYLQEYRD